MGNFPVIRVLSEPLYPTPKQRTNRPPTCIAIDFEGEELIPSWNIEVEIPIPLFVVPIERVELVHRHVGVDVVDVEVDAGRALLELRRVVVDVQHCNRDLQEKMQV